MNIEKISHMKTVFLTLSLSLSLILSQAVNAQETNSPIRRVEAMVSSVLSILQDESLSIEQSKVAVKEDLFNSFDARAMAQSVLSSNWKKATEPQQEEFQALFLQILEDTYIDRIEAYTDERVEFVTENINNKRSVVETIIVTGSNNIPVNYKLRLRSDGWFIYDVEVENVSLISSYRDTYRSIVKKSGVDGLLTQMQDKINEV